MLCNAAHAVFVKSLIHSPLSVNYHVQADRQGLGCLLEKTWNGTKPMKFADGAERLYLEDGGTVTLRGYCQGPGYRVGFGECIGQVLPSSEPS